MIDKDRMICVCNSLDMREVAECIKEHDFQSVKQIIENSECPRGDKCENCIEEG